MTTTTTTEQPLKRCAILGTAPSWKQCRWEDPTLEIWGLNDGYLLGVPRANRWFDLHPFHQMHFRPSDQKHVSPADVPLGVYLRPEGHLEWLRTRPIPVYLAEARPDYPTSRTFPKQDILEFFKPYWPWRLSRTGEVTSGDNYEVSTPSWMLMQALYEGYAEIHIYGIHLATEWEYVQQRPNFEFLIGIAVGRGVKVVLPEQAPICRAAYQYAFEPKSDLPQQEAQRRIGLVKQEGAKLRQELATLPFYARAARNNALARLDQLDVDLIDAKNMLSRTHALSMT